MQLLVLIACCVTFYACGNCYEVINREKRAGEVEGATLLLDLLRFLGDSGAFTDSDVYRRKTDSFLFYEGRYCSQNIAGSFWDDDNSVKINAKDESFIKNDEAQSMLIQGPLRAGNIVWVCDSPTCCNCDDETRIYVKNDVPEGKGYCVHSFENSYNDHFVDVQYHRKNGLNGKVSQVKNYD